MISNDRDPPFLYTIENPDLERKDDYRLQENQ